ncbi:hypothetical protein C8R43DRAFT_964524 [Mycena crocata]|nr:hypothetical protein C8R43DRAFT_964524 [Mycena crocata]
MFSDDEEPFRPFKFQNFETPEIAEAAAPMADVIARRTILERTLHPPYTVGTSNRDVFFGQEVLDNAEAINQVIEWLPGARELKERLEAKVTGLMEELRLARLDLSLAKKMILENASIVAARTRMPNEILLEIFKLVITTKRDVEQLQAVLVLSHVCRAWRFIAVNEPSFWTNMIIPPVNAWGRGWKTGLSPWGDDMTDFGFVRPAESPSSEAQVEGLRQRLRRTKTNTLDIVLSADESPLEDGMVEMLVEQAERWGSLELRSPELISIPPNDDEDEEMGWVRHPFVNGLEPVIGRLTALKALRVEGHNRRGKWGALTSHNLWQGDEPEERDKLPWFSNTHQLRQVVSDMVYYPEETLLLPWGQIEAYREERTERAFTLPLSHLRRMHELKVLRLGSVWLPNPDGSDENFDGALLCMPKLTWLRMDLPSDYIPDFLSGYDRLGVLVLPALTCLDLLGRELSATASIPIDVSILGLRDRSGGAAWGLVHLTLWTSTGVNAESSMKLLTNIPTLMTFAVKDDPNARRERILTKAFLRKFQEIQLSVTEFTVDGAFGCPIDAKRKVDTSKEWMGLFLEFLAFQFRKKLRIMTIVPSKTASESCLFHPEGHHQISTLMAQHKNCRLIIHDDRSPPGCTGEDVHESSIDVESDSETE